MWVYLIFCTRISAFSIDLAIPAGGGVEGEQEVEDSDEEQEDGDEEEEVGDQEVEGSGEEAEGEGEVDADGDGNLNRSVAGNSTEIASEGYWMVNYASTDRTDTNKRLTILTSKWLLNQKL